MCENECPAIHVCMIDRERGSQKANYTLKCPAVRPPPPFSVAVLFVIEAAMVCSIYAVIALILWRRDIYLKKSRLKKQLQRRERRRGTELQLIYANDNFRSVSSTSLTPSCLYDETTVWNILQFGNNYVIMCDSSMLKSSKVNKVIDMFLSFCSMSQFFLSTK